MTIAVVFWQVLIAPHYTKTNQRLSKLTYKFYSSADRHEYAWIHNYTYRVKVIGHMLTERHVDCSGTVASQMKNDLHCVLTYNS